MLRSLFMVATVTWGTFLGQTHVAQAQRVGITADIATRQIVLNGQTITITRIQETARRLDNEFTKSSRPGPPFCIAPISAAPGDRTLGELEVMDALATDVADGRGLLIVFQSDRAETGAPGGAQVSRANTDRTAIAPHTPTSASAQLATTIKATQTPVRVMTDESDLGDLTNGVLAERSVAATTRPDAMQTMTATALARIVSQATAADGISASTLAPVADSDGIALRIGARGDRETPQHDLYPVDSGDSLGAIAIRFHGDVRHYTAIFDANRVQRASPGRIRAGQRLVIPKV